MPKAAWTRLWPLGAAAQLTCSDICSAVSLALTVYQALFSAGHTLVGKMGKQNRSEGRGRAVVRRQLRRVSGRHQSLARDVWRGQRRDHTPTPEG